VDELGGAVDAIEQGFIQDEIERAAFAWQRAVESGDRVIVGVNRYQEEFEPRVELHKIDPDAERRQIERTARVRAERNAGEAAQALQAVREAARGQTNLLPFLREGLRAHCTIGELCEALREEWGMYDTGRSRL
jgi:methylmalonyl-CoA mutase N-terminal domain/subunit